MSAETRPLLAEASAFLRRRWSVLGGALDAVEKMDAADLDRCESTLASLRRVHPSREAWERALDAVGEYTVAYLREQVAYAQSGTYAKSTFEEAAEQVYLDAELMGSMYLPGLYLTQAFWPVHVRIGGLFEDEFLPRVADRGTLVEVGVGHGWTFTRLLRARPAVSGVGFDFSPSALEFTRALATAEGLAESRWELHRADVQVGLAFPDGAADVVVSGEVLEHIAHPEKAAAEFRRVLRPGGAAFVTTAIDSPAIDHITNWPDPETVDALLRAAGFAIDARFVLRPADFSAKRTRFVDTTKNYVAVLHAV